MDWLILLGVIAAWIPALFVFFQYRSLKEQIKFMENQALFQRASHYPLLEIKKVQVRGDKVLLKIENAGNGLASNVGLYVSFQPLVIKEIIPEKGVRLDGGFVELKKKMGDKDAQVTPCGIVIPLKLGNKKHFIKAGEEVEAEARFQFSVKVPRRGIFGKLDWSLPRSWDGGDFKELTEFMRDNKIFFFVLYLSVAYQDLTQSITELTKISEFVVDLTKEVTLEDAFKEEKPIPIAHFVNFFECATPFELYKDMKTSRGYL